MVHVIRQLKSYGGRHSRQLNSRAQWDSRAHWYRLRYPDAGRMQDVLNLLSRHGDRIALRWRRQDGVSRLYVGVVTDALDYVLQEMARDLGFQLSAAADLPEPLSGGFSCAHSLSEDSTAGPGHDWAADGYLIGGHLFSLTRNSMPENGRLSDGRHFPDVSAANGHEPGRWQMPALQLGVATRPGWTLSLPPALQPKAGDGDRWLLGRSAEKKVLHGRRLSLYGAEESVRDWLACLVIAHATRRPAGLVVVDGQGDLAPTLLAAPVIAGHLRARRAASLDVNVVGQGGVNPLAAVTGEEAARQLARWRHWFAGMGVAESGLALLPEALAAGVTDLAQMAAWLDKPAVRNPYYAAVAPFRALLERLGRSPVTSRWLTLYPAELTSLATGGLLLINCPYRQEWPRLQALRAVVALLAASQADLVLHRVPLGQTDLDLLSSLRVVIDTQHLGETVVISRCNRRQAEKAAAHLLGRSGATAVGSGSGGQNDAAPSPAALIEQMQQLGEGEALITRDGQVTWSSWM
jgi:hypothetical protein